jgi:hypothetical protein
MTAVTIQRVIPRPIEAVWAVVSDLEAHPVTLTRIDTDAGPPRVGWAFVALTGIGRLRFADRMSSPLVAAGRGRARVRHRQDRLLGGWAAIRLEAPTAPARD